MPDTPTSRLVEAAQATSEIIDSQDRRLLVRRLTAIDKLRLFKAAGPVLAQNQPWLGIAVLAACVVAVDGVPVPAPTTEAQIEGLVARLGDSGIAAIAVAIANAQPSPGSIAHAGN